MRSLVQHGLDQRLAQTFYGLAFYLWKTAAPAGLSPLYEIPLQFSTLDGSYLACGITVVALTLLFTKFHESFPAGLAVWIYYIAMLAPVLGIAQSGPQLVADRYSYLSCLGWALLAGGGFLWVWNRWLNEGLTKLVAILGLVLLPVGGLSVLTWKQTQVWRDSEILYNRVLSVTPNSRIAHNNLAGVLVNWGRIDEATKHYDRALQIDPNYEWTHYNLGRLLAAQGKVQEAEQRFRRALELNPNFLLAHHHLGVLLTRQGKSEEALAHFLRATEIDSSYVEGHNNIGLILAAQGRIEEAVQHYRQALEIKPEFVLAEVNLGDALMLQGRMDEAIEHYRKAVANDPDLAVGHYSLGVALAKRGDFADALNHLRRAIEIDPQNVRMRQSLEELVKEQRGKKAATAP
jgi:tetratricopeptide (TPR) repeat protein